MTIKLTNYIYICMLYNLIISRKCIGSASLLYDLKI
jgi:hypothetical protein